jgi:hypothetical protein
VQHLAAGAENGCRLAEQRGDAPLQALQQLAAAILVFGQSRRQVRGQGGQARARVGRRVEREETGAAEVDGFLFAGDFHTGVLGAVRLSA